MTVIVLSMLAVAMVLTALSVHRAPYDLQLSGGHLIAPDPEELHAASENPLYALIGT